MNKKIFIKELKDYFSIFSSFLIIFVLFSNNMSFAAASCADIDSFTKLDHCRDYGEKPFTVGEVDMDGNKPITCNDVSLDYNPYTSDDYYYDKSNSMCLAWALGISITYATASVAAGYGCTVGGAPTQIGPLTQKAAKIQKFKKILDYIKKAGNFAIQVGQTTAITTLSDPVVTLQIDFGIDAAITTGTMIANIISCATTVGTGANFCSMAGTCGAFLATLTVLSQTLIFATTGGLYGEAKSEINKVKVCGYDWNTYAYTEYDMQQPENEWYPQYGSFSNSYSYALNKIINGEYSCVGYLEDDNGGKDNVNLTVEAKNCYSNSDACKAEIKQCIENQKKKSYPSINIDECLTDSSSCSDYCKGYFAKCEPIKSILDDGDGVCKDNNGKVYKKDNDKDLFKCKNVKSNYKNIRNKFYRESIYKGKEFKISTDYNDTVDCIDPRLDNKKGYTGLEQRYYFRGKEAAQYACSRFKYTNEGCRLADGTVITKEEAAADPQRDLKCREAFQDAAACCQNRRAMGICIYNSSKNDRDNNALCMRSLDGKAETCTINTGGVNNPKFVAYSGQADSTQICVKNYNYCPYTYNVAGGTELQELYCAGDNNCTDCVNETGDKNDEWQGIKYRDGKGKIKKEYRYKIPLCSDRDTIWKKDRYKYPTMAYGNVKNFCRYRAHCTEIGESDYEFTDMTTNKFLPKVCSDFVGDSQNLPYPVRVADLTMAGNIKAIIRSTGVNIGDGSLNSLYSAIDSMSGDQLAIAYSAIIAERAILSLTVGMVVGGFTSPLIAIITSASAGGAFAIEDIKTAVENDKNAKTTLKNIVRNIVDTPVISTVDFSLGEYRGFTAPMAQCIKETLSNMFLNRAGQSICAKEGESVNSEGLCGNDTFGPPERIREDAYIQMVGEQLPEDSNILYKIQSRLQTIIKLVAVLAIIVIGLKFLMKGDLDVFDLKKPKMIIVGMLKFAIVFYFAVGNAWQSKFYEWLDKATQYIYYKSFNLSLLGYQDYKNQADKTRCKVVTKGKFCKEYTYFEPVLVEKEVEKERDVCKTFNYTGSQQTFVVPNGVNKVTLKVWGAQGGGTYGGLGGYATGTLTINSDVLYIYVGGKGSFPQDSATGASGGYNGGGKGGLYPIESGSILGDIGILGSAGGGGATDIRVGGTSLNNRIIVAGGGGGASSNNVNYGYGGSANIGDGGDGITVIGLYGDFQTKGGKSGANGGKGGDGFDKNGEDGTKGNGGSGADSESIFFIPGGGGGGGYIGGGGGGAGSNGILDYVQGSLGYHGGGGGSGSSYTGGVSNGSVLDSVQSGNGKAQICYKEKYKAIETVTENQERTGTYCDYDITSTEKNKLIEDLADLPSPMPTGSDESCKIYGEGTSGEYQKCYSECKTGPDYDENGNEIFEYSDKYDGCYFGDSVYPEGKSYLAIFDSLDCKLMNYFGYGPDVDLPNILHMLLISLFFSPLAVITVILGSLLFVILLVIVIKILYLFLMSAIAMNIMIFVSPVIFPTLLFEKYKGIFNKWLDNLASFCLQFVFVIIFTGFLIGNLDSFAIGSAKWVGHDRTTGRLPTLVCGDATDSIVCIFKVNTSKGTTPLLGEKIGKFLGIGPIVSVADSINKDFFGTVTTLLKFCLVIYILLEFLKKIPGVASDLTNGMALDPGQLDSKAMMDKIKDTTKTIGKGTSYALKKGIGSFTKKKDKEEPRGKGQIGVADLGGIDDPNGKEKPSGDGKNKPAGGAAGESGRASMTSASISSSTDGKK